MFVPLHLNFHSSPPSASYMRQRTGSTLIQVAACRLFSAKPLPEPMLVYCHLDSCFSFSEIWIGILPFSLKKIHLKLSSAKKAAIFSKGGWVNTKLFCVNLIPRTHGITLSPLTPIECTADSPPNGRVDWPYLLLAGSKGRPWTTWGSRQ